MKSTEDIEREIAIAMENAAQSLAGGSDDIRKAVAQISQIKARKKTGHELTPEDCAKGGARSQPAHDLRRKRQREMITQYVHDGASRDHDVALACVLVLSQLGLEPKELKLSIFDPHIGRLFHRSFVKLFANIETIHFECTLLATTEYNNELENKWGAEIASLTKVHVVSGFKAHRYMDRMLLTVKKFHFDFNQKDNMDISSSALAQAMSSVGQMILENGMMAKAPWVRYKRRIKAQKSSNSIRTT